MSSHMSTPNNSCAASRQKRDRDAAAAEVQAAEAAATAVKSLIAKAETRPDGATALYVAVESNNLHLVKTILDTPDHFGITLNKKTNDGYTALDLAVIESHIPIIKAIASAPAVRDQDDEGRTALHKLVCGHYSLPPGVLRVLFEVRPGVLDAKDNDGCTALRLAAQNSRLGVANSLLQFGANPWIANDAGVTPLQVAETSPQLAKMAELIKKATTLERWKGCPENPLAILSSSSTSASLDTPPTVAADRSLLSQFLGDRGDSGAAEAADEQQPTTKKKETSTQPAPPQSRPQPGAATSTDEYVTTHVISVRGHEEFVCVSHLNKEKADVISSLRHDLLTNEDELKETKAHYSQEVKRLKSDLSKLQAQGAQVPQPGLVAQVQDPLPAQVAALDLAHNSAVDLQKQLDTVRGELTSKKEELMETKTHHAQEIAQLKSDLSKLQVTVNQGVKNDHLVAQLKESLVAQVAALDSAHNSAVDLQEQLDTVRGELTSKKEELDDFKKDRTQVQDFIAAQCVELDAAQKSVVELERQLEAAQGKLVAEQQYSSQQLNDLRDTHAKETATSELNANAMRKELMDAQLQLASTEGEKTALVEQAKEKSAELMRSIHQDHEDFQEERQTLEEKATAAQKSVVELAAAAAQEIALLRTQKDQVQAQKDQLDAAFFVDREGIMNANHAAFAQMAARHRAELETAEACFGQGMRNVEKAWCQFILQLHTSTLEQAQLDVAARAQ